MKHFLEIWKIRGKFGKAVHPVSLLISRPLLWRIVFTQQRLDFSDEFIL